MQKGKQRFCTHIHQATTHLLLNHYNLQRNLTTFWTWGKPVLICQRSARPQLPRLGTWIRALPPWTAVNHLSHSFRSGWMKQFREHQLPITTQAQPSDMAPKAGHALQLHRANLGNYHCAQFPVWEETLSHSSCLDTVFPSPYHRVK